MNALRTSLFALAAISFTACTTEAPAPAPEIEDEPDAAAPDAAAPDAPEPAQGSFILELSTDKLPILQGTNETVKVTVKRTNGFGGTITLSALGLPQGVTMAEVTIDADEDETEVELRAPESAPHSLPTSVKIKGTAASASAEKVLTVTVYGLPGSLDTSFAGGKVVVPVGRSEDYARAMAVQADGKIIVAGHTAENLGDFTLLRLERDGTIDTSFGTNGIVSTQVGSGADMAYAVAVQKDGKIVVAGNSAVTSADKDFAVVRYADNGSLDKSFGHDGIVTTALGSDSDTAYALLIQPDGKIVLGGDANRQGSGEDFALVRYNVDGSLDESFGESGKVLTAITSNSGGDTIHALAWMEIDGKGRILAAGGEGDFKAARFHEDGTLDATFGQGGKIDGMFRSTIGSATAITATENGQVLVAGSVMHDFAVVRLNTDGSFDTNFGKAGKVTTPVSATNWDEAKGLALEADGKVVLGGWVYEGVGTAGNFALVRYTKDGALDATFGAAGIVVTEVAAPMRRDEGTAVLLQTDERVPTVRVLLAGWAASANSDFAVTRYWR